MSRQIHWRRAAAVGAGALATAAILGVAQPAGTPAPVIEYASLSRTSTDAESGGRSSRTTEWRLCAPGEDVAGEGAIASKFPASGPPSALAEVAILNGLSQKGWELVSHAQSTSYEPRQHNGTTTRQERVTVDQWWLRRPRPVK
jgi:hypothetical protein